LVKWKFFPKKGHSKIFVPPKVGARSPPMPLGLGPTNKELDLCRQNSDVQRFLDARDQRGSWMPGAGQIPKFSFLLKKIMSIRIPKFLTTFFLGLVIITKIFKLLPKLSNSSPKISDDFLKAFIYISFFTNTGPLDAPLCTPLHKKH